jgi:hypothetical protein
MCSAAARVKNTMEESFNGKEKQGPGLCLLLQISEARGWSRPFQACGMVIEESGFSRRG